jgi:hypothetical protein
MGAFLLGKNCAAKCICDGLRGIRTPSLLHAMQARYRCAISPKDSGKTKKKK